MPARYRRPRATAEPGGVLRVQGTIENATSETWRAANGFAIGAQVYDPQTSLFISEGEWSALPRDVAPGESAPLDIQVALPPEPGDYRVYISPREEKSGWHYERGAPFLVVDARVTGDRIDVLRTEVSTVARLRLRALGPALKKVLLLPFQSLWRHRALVRSMVRREIQARYRGSLGEIVWTWLHPLLLMALYFFVFGVVLNARFPNDPSRAGFSLYFLAGMLPWLAFSEPVGRAPFVIVEHRNFVKKLRFPLETLPVNQVVSGLVTQGFAIVVFMVLLLIIRDRIPWTFLWLPVLLVPQIMFTTGVCWLLAASGVFFRDLGQIIGFALTLWFFLTPICYPESALPNELLPILGKNPMWTLARGFRAVFLERSAPEFAPLWKLWLLGLMVFLLGHAVFYKLRRSFADVV